MSDNPNPAAIGPVEEPVPPMVLPVRRPQRSQAERRPDASGGGFGRILLALMLLGSLGLNLLMCLITMGIARFPAMESDDELRVIEKHYSGSNAANDKVAVIHIEGVLVDELTGHTLRQIDRAAKDPDVKAVVVRINSPGGTVSASDEIYKRLLELKNGNSPRYASQPKTMVVSMGPMAASGGYYIAVPANWIMAERSTITGSIGVYASFINVHKLADDHGVKMELVKHGEMKAAGSPFHKLQSDEKQMWQDMVDNSYEQFLDVIQTNRAGLRGKLTKDLIRTDAKGQRLADVAPERDEKGNPIPGKMVPYKRKLADGGIFIAAEAKQHGLIDEIGYLDDAAKKAAALASLTDYRVVDYERPLSLLSLLGMGAKQSNQSDFSRIASAAGPRMWYLAPQSEFAGMLAVMGKE